MDQYIKFIKNNRFFFLTFFVIILLRFIWIDRFPTGMQYDEVEYSLSSKSFQMMGTDVSGVGFPKSLVTTNTLGKVSPVPYMVLSPFWSILDLNMVTYRTAYVILNILTSVAFMGLLQVLFKKKNLSLLSGIIFLLNPWSFFLSRHAIDGAFALFFYILGSLFLLKNYSKRNLFLSFIFFFLGAFSYHGAKLQLVPLILSISMFKIFTEKNGKNLILPYSLLTTAFILIIGMFVISGSLVSGSILQERTGEIVFTNSNSFSGEVNTMRTASIDSPIHQIMINKWGFVLRYFFGNYFNAFSFYDLFLGAEIIKYSGFFYIFEAAFLIFGFTGMFLQKRKIFYLLVVITAIAPLSTALSMSGLSVLNRGILLLPALLIFITYGLYFAFKIVKVYIPKNLFILSVGLLYAGSFFIYMHLYFFILPIEVNAHYRTNTRVLAKYLSHEKNNASQIVILTTNPRVLYSGLVFYLPKNEQEAALRTKQTYTTTRKFTIDNITLTENCFPKFDPNYTYIIDREKTECFKKLPADQLIIDQKDAGIDYFLVGGRLCKDIQLSRWINPHKISDFNIDSMEIEEFCSRWISTAKLPN